ncbi:MAG: cob(I)yrinic acid a,c-diamide adenosyltransferase [Clostridia bacterium]|nr:cob(I)yrinic acid a,c-diamide adenosyltransferase [Clostridia bacterium]
MRGLVHIYTGDGKGKTSAAVGLGLRAWGRGMKVLMVQFLKGSQSGELIAAQKLGETFKINLGTALKKFTWEMNKAELQEAAAAQKKQFEYARKESESRNWDVLILDEIMAAIQQKMISADKVMELIVNKPEELELVLTGRNAPDVLIDKADYVSRIMEVKHPFNKGIQSRTGIEE